MYDYWIYAENVIEKFKNNDLNGVWGNNVLI
jgi:hypothetical protein